NKDVTEMTAALATLAFLATLWLLVVVGAAVLEQTGAKIIAALKGQSMEPAIKTALMPVRHRERGRTAYRATAPYAAPARRRLTCA
ncbi:MAG: hypothetical protein ACREBM_07695, partial [Sphingomicrobium sp.]